MEFKDYYKILGVARGATQDEIKRSYRKLARKFHPDVSKEPDAEERFKEVQEAYEVLKDPEKRAAYDQLGSRWKEGQDFRPPPDWDAGFEFSGGGFTPGDAGGFSDFFDALFGRGFAAGPGARQRHGRFQMRGGDHRARVRISLADAYHGSTRAVTLRVPETDAQGRVHTRTRTLNVRIPKGVTEGQQIRLAGQGAPGVGGGPQGDLYLEVSFEPDPRFRAEGRDVHVQLPITPWEAALGANIEIPTLGGSVAMKIPAGSQTGNRLRLRGRGLPGGPPGDQIVELRIMTPPADNARARDLYRRMADELKFDPRSLKGA